MYLRTALSPLTETLEPRQWRNCWLVHHATIAVCQDCGHEEEFLPGSIMDDHCTCYPSYEEALAESTDGTNEGWPPGSLTYIGPKEVT